MLRSGVAAAQLALRTPVKKEEGDVKQEEKPEGKVQISPEPWYIYFFGVHFSLNKSHMLPLLFFYFLPTKEKGDDSLAKKRKTEWQAALKKLPGDTSFVQAWAYFLFLLSFDLLLYVLMSKFTANKLNLNTEIQHPLLIFV